MRNISLDSFVVSPPVPVLFKTVAMKHSLQIGSSPYHYIIALNRNGTSWSLRHLLGPDSGNSPVRLNVSRSGGVASDNLMIDRLMKNGMGLTGMGFDFIMMTQVELLNRIPIQLSCYQLYMTERAF